jgi:hypothetical protein
MITDYRANLAAGTDGKPCCGIVGSLLQPDINSWVQNVSNSLTSVLNGYSSEFTTWFNNVKGQLSTDAAGNLQNQVDERVKLINTSNLDTAVTPGVYHCTSNSISAPPNTYQDFGMMVIDKINPAQIVHNFENNRLLYRLKTGSSWSAWKEITTSPISADPVITLSFPSGSMTARLKKQGVNVTCLLSGGTVTPHPDGSTLVTLPDGYRPSQATNFQYWNLNASGMINFKMNTSGIIVGTRIVESTQRTYESTTIGWISN